MSPAHCGAELLDEVRAFLGRFVAFPSDAALDAVTLWAAVTHLAQHFHITPRVALLSPEPGSGKTRVLEVLALLVARSFFSFSASAAAIFRTLALEPRTLLFDEVDAIFTRKGKDDGNEDLRALLNVGYRRGATIPRCVGPRHEVQLFDVFAPAALAGLGDLPDTLMSRSVIVRMRRRAPGERIEQFRVRMHEPEGLALRERLEAWAEEVGPVVGDAWPELPDGVVDREAELWEPLIAIADAVGGHWPDTARAACVEMLKVASDREVSLGVRLLSDLRTVFADRDAMSSADILEALNDMDEAPWGDLYGKPLQSRTLARMLRRYDVRSVKVRPPGEAPRQGYRREDLWDTWRRYLAVDSAEAEHPEHADSGSALRVPDAQQRVPFNASAAEPAEHPERGPVPDVPEHTPGTEHAERVTDGVAPHVPDVPDVREPGSAPTAEGDLGQRAAARVAELRPLDRSDLEQRYRAAAQLVRAPEWWETTARVEPVQVTAAVELIALDAAAGSVNGNAHAYLKATRAAFDGKVTA